MDGTRNENGGDINVTALSFSSTASTAVSSVLVGSSLSVTQAYAPSASAGLFKNTVTLTNTGNIRLYNVAVVADTMALLSTQHGRAAGGG